MSKNMLGESIKVNWKKIKKDKIDYKKRKDSQCQIKMIRVNKS